MRNFFISLFLLALIGLLISLGFWQLDRAHEKQNILNQQALGQTQKPISLQEIQKLDSSMALKSIRLTGTFDNQHSFLLDNKFNKHRPGYQVITPFHDQKTGHWVLVNRGWISQGQGRSETPKIPAVSGVVTILGVINSSADKGFVLGKSVENATIWPVLLQRINYDNIAALLKVPVLPFVVLLDPKESFGFVREWQFVTINPERHLGYAVQWFALAITLIILLIVYQVKNRREKKSDV
ncbi:MAG: SURF1 family protein [Proteobacteria bacterium]|nr:SURF1 family protein [Pseudomonadota bacterium]